MKQKRIAILPFKNKSDSSWDYIAQGLTDLALNTLMQKSDYLVISKESIEHLMKDSTITYFDIYDKLNVDILLLATLEVKEDLQLKIKVETKNDVLPLWENFLQADLKNIVLFGNDLVDFLNKRFEIESTKKAVLNEKLPANHQAYRTYLLGNHYLNRWNRAYTELALHQFEKVTEIEPDFIPAYLGIAKATVFLVSRGWRSAEKHYPEVTEMLNRMILLNPNFGELFIYKGIIEYFYLLDWESAFKNIEKGLKNYSEASESYAQLSLFWYGMRQYDKSIESIHIAMEYNPLSISLLNMLGDVQLSAERYDESIKTFQYILELQPNDKIAIENLMYIGAITENFTMARKYLRLLTKDSDVSVVTHPRLAYVFPKLGMEQEAEILFNELNKLIIEDKDTNHYNRLANYYSALKDWENTMSCIEKSFALRTGIIFILTDPQIKPLHKWERFRKLELNIKLPLDIIKSEKIRIKTELKTAIEINPEQLLYAESEGNYTTLVTYNNFRLEKILVRMSIKSLMSQLPPNRFFQCHRSFIINKSLALESFGNARGYTLKSNKYGFEIPVSRAKISEMKGVVGEFR